MSRRKHTRTERLREIADDIEPAWPEHAQYLRGLVLGQSGKRDADGFTPLVKKQRLHWLAVKTIGDEGEQLAECMALTGKTEDAAVNFILLIGYDELRRCLKSHGDI